MIASKSIQILLLTLIARVSSFATFAKIRNRIPRNARPQTENRALIIGWDDDGETYEEEQSSFLDEGYCLFEDCTDPGSNIAQNLSHNPDKVASLARLAVAFSPEERGLTIDDIEHIEVISVDDHHIEISAVICETDGCVTLFVPVDFHHNCNIDGMEECVLDNIFELDMEAQDILNQKKEATSQADKVRLNDDETYALYHGDQAKFPSWWVAPGILSDMSTECDTIQRLLNADDFIDDVNALAKRGLEMANADHMLEIKRAIVVAVGPAGLYLRAAVSERDGSSEDERTATVLDIPYIFEGDTDSIKDGESLRTAVLSAIASTSIPTPKKVVDVVDKVDEVDLSGKEAHLILSEETEEEIEEAEAHLILSEETEEEIEEAETHLILSEETEEEIEQETQLILLDEKVEKEAHLIFSEETEEEKEEETHLILPEETEEEIEEETHLTLLEEKVDLIFPEEKVDLIFPEEKVDLIFPEEKVVEEAHLIVPEEKVVEEASSNSSSSLPNMFKVQQNTKKVRFRIQNPRF